VTGSGTPQAFYPKRHEASAVDVVMQDPLRRPMEKPFETTRRTWASNTRRTGSGGQRSKRRTLGGHAVEKRDEIMAVVSGTSLLLPPALSAEHTCWDGQPGQPGRALGSLMNSALRCHCSTVTSKNPTWDVVDSYIEGFGRTSTHIPKSPKVEPKDIASSGLRGYYE